MCAHNLKLFTHSFFLKFLKRRCSLKNIWLTYFSSSSSSSSPYNAIKWFFFSNKWHASLKWFLNLSQWFIISAVLKVHVKMSQISISLLKLFIFTKCSLQAADADVSVYFNWIRNEINILLYMSSTFMRYTNNFAFYSNSSSRRQKWWSCFWWDDDVDCQSKSKVQDVERNLCFFLLINFSPHSTLCWLSWSSLRGSGKKAKSIKINDLKNL